jgi:hypothetical protein
MAQLQMDTAPFTGDSITQVVIMAKSNSSKGLWANFQKHTPASYWAFAAV